MLTKLTVPDSLNFVDLALEREPVTDRLPCALEALDTGLLSRAGAYGHERVG